MSSITNGLLQCRVCGLEQSESPWGIEGNTPSFNICPCCGVEFGNEDSTLNAVRQYRKTWIVNGAKWFKPKAQPRSWDLEEQLKQIPSEYI